MKNNETSLFMERLLAAQDNLHGYVAAMMPFYPSDVDDVVQETNQALILHAADYDPARAFLPWMLAFAKNQILAFRRRRQADRLVFDEAVCDRCAAFLNEDSADTREPVLKRLRICRERLPERQRKLLDLRYEKDWKVRKIAREVGNTPRNIRDNLAYIRKKLADCLHRLCRLDDEAVNQAYPDPSKTDDAMLDLIEGGHLPRDSRGELIRALSVSDDEHLHRYFEQMRVHALLSHEAQLHRHTETIRRQSSAAFRFRRALGRAALFAALAAGFAWGIVRAVVSRSAASAPAEIVPAAPAPVQRADTAPASPAPAAEIKTAEQTPPAVTTPAIAVAAAETVAVKSQASETVTVSVSQTKGDEEMKTGVALLSAAAATAAAVLVTSADDPSYSEVTFLDTREVIDAWSPAITLDTAKAIGTIYRFD